jgi:hypothetical protein
MARIEVKGSFLNLDVIPKIEVNGSFLNHVMTKIEANEGFLGL